MSLLHYCTDSPSYGVARELAKSVPTDQTYELLAIQNAHDLHAQGYRNSARDIWELVPRSLRPSQRTGGPPHDDHGLLLLLDGKPSVYVSEPYFGPVKVCGYEPFGWQEAIRAFCVQFGLACAVNYRFKLHPLSETVPLVYYPCRKGTPS